MSDVVKISKIRCKGCGIMIRVETMMEGGYQKEIHECSCGYVNTNWSSKGQLEKPKRFNIHRHYYVDGKKHFSFFFDPDITDKEMIAKKFFDDKDWKWFLNFYKVKVEGYEVSDDLLRMDIRTSPLS